ncbi:MAG: GerMN domain-containing protein [Trueperaceae bacterium]
MRTVVLRVAALAALLLLVLATVLTLQTMQRLPDTLVYLVADSGTNFRLESVGRRSNADSPEERARAAITELAEGPTASERERGLTSVVPVGTSVHGILLIDAVLEVDLSGEFESGGGSAAMQGRLNQLFYTLTQPAGIDGVRLFIDGRPAVVFGGEGIIVDSPWLRSQHSALPVW